MYIESYVSYISRNKDQVCNLPNFDLAETTVNRYKFALRQRSTDIYWSVISIRRKGSYYHQNYYRMLDI